MLCAGQRAAVLPPRPDQNSAPEPGWQNPDRVPHLLGTAPLGAAQLLHRRHVAAAAAAIGTPPI